MAIARRSNNVGCVELLTLVGIDYLSRTLYHNGVSFFPFLYVPYIQSLTALAKWPENGFV